MATPATAPSGTSTTRTREEIIVTSPWDGKEIGRCPVMSADEVRAVTASAQRAQQRWAKTSISDRVRVLRKYRGVFIERAPEIVDLGVRENGKTREEAISAEVMAPTLFMTYYPAKGPKALKPHRLRRWGLSALVTSKSWVHYAPRGVVGIISPWNYPVAVPMTDMIPAMLAGNAVVLKPSEWAPLMALKLKEFWDDTPGAPNDLFQIVTGYGATGAALIDSGIHKMVFTGSTNVGRIVGAACAERLIPCTLELGGKASALVLDDAKLERTARAIVWGSFFNSGQTCIGIERVYAHNDIHDALLGRVVELTKSLRLGQNLGRATTADMGAMPFPKQIDVVDSLVTDAAKRGAEILTGGNRPKGPGRFYPPTVVAGATADMPIMNAEIFGPAVPFMKYDNLDEVIDIANRSHLGLNSYVFGSDRGRARRVAERIQAGTVMINDTLASFAYPELPFGGLKDSGVGRNHGLSGLRAMCETRIVNDHRKLPMNREMWWHPYHRKVGDLLLNRLGLMARLMDSLF